MIELPTKKLNPKRSESAKLVAEKVLETIRKGKVVNKGKIIREVGYSEKTAIAPTTVTNTKSYREVIDPFVEKMAKQRERMIDAIATKNLDKEKLRDLSDGIDKLTKNMQLLSGKETDRIAGKIIFLPPRLNNQNEED